MDGPLFAAINAPVADALLAYRSARLGAAKAIAKMNGEHDRLRTTALAFLRCHVCRQIRLGDSGGCHGSRIDVLIRSLCCRVPRGVLAVAVGRHGLRAQLRKLFHRHGRRLQPAHRLRESSNDPLTTLSPGSPPTKALLPSSTGCTRSTSPPTWRCTSASTTTAAAATNRSSGTSPTPLSARLRIFSAHAPTAPVIRRRIGRESRHFGLCGGWLPPSDAWAWLADCSA